MSGGVHVALCLYGESQIVKVAQRIETFGQIGESLVEVRFKPVETFVHAVFKSMQARTVEKRRDKNCQNKNAGGDCIVNHRLRAL